MQRPAHGRCRCPRRPSRSWRACLGRGAASGSFRAASPALTCASWATRGACFAPGRVLPDVRLHDLRHSVASRALALGEELPMIGKLLGHRRIESTVRYAHLARAAVREAAERVANSLAEDIL